MFKNIFRVFLFSLIMFFTLTEVFAQDFQFDPTMTADKLWGKVDASLAGLRDYTSDFNVDGSSRDLHVNVNGKLACVLPNKLKLTLEGLPAFLGDHKEIMSDHSLQETIDRKLFSHSIAMTEVLNGEPYYVIKSTALEPNGSLQEARFWISAIHYTSNKVILRYASGGYVRATQRYQNVQGYMLPDYQNISVSFPEWRAEFVVQFSNFALNTGINI